MSDEQSIPNGKPAEKAPNMVEQPPRRSGELSSEDLDQAAGGLLPAVSPDK